MDHLTLLEFTQTIRKALEKNLDPTYWVVAEIGELRIHSKGHCYLELIEKKNEKIIARIKATIWAYTYQNLSQWFERITGSNLKEGMKILSSVDVQFHETYGLSVNIRDIDARFTLGERQKLKQEVLNRLSNEGVLNKNRDLALPQVPQKIAVISSEHSAGYDDFLNQLKASVYSFETTFFPALLQGEEATRSVVEALKSIFSRIDDFDLVAILRGGGAQADLDCFNTYLMGKAIARFPLPVITGIGHDRDETIADLVANTRQKTPTAVAEFLISGMRSFEEKIMHEYEQIIAKSQHAIVSAGNEIDKIARDIFLRTKQHGKNTQIRLDSLQQQISRASKTALNRAAQKINGFDKLFQMSDPAFTLRRGFTYSSINGRPLGKVKKIKSGAELKTVSTNNTVFSVVKDVVKKSKDGKGTEL